MPCYTAWNEYLQRGTPEYQRAEDQVRSKLKSIKHIIDYYYSANNFQKPDLPDGTKIDALRQPKSKLEQRIRESICFHFACDEVSVSTLYDASSLLCESRRDERAYLAVMLPSASLLRQQPEKFKTAY